MKKFLLPEGGNFYKVNLHCHSTISDGKMTLEEIKELYKAHGYSAVAFTDHDVFIPHPELNDDDFIALHGYEMEVNESALEETPFKHKKTCHMCFVALSPDNTTQVCWNREKYVPTCSLESKGLVKFDENEPDYERVYSQEGISDMMNRGRAAGFFVSYNHPTWSFESYPEYSGYCGMHAMEIVNNSCLTLGYDEHNERVYDDMLRAGKRIFCTATDDNHRLDDACGAYVMVKADKLGYTELTDGLLAGNFYSSEGPEIKSLWYEDGVVHIETSPVTSIRAVCGRRHAVNIRAGEEPLTKGSFKVLEDDIYVRFVITDSNGKKAYTSAYFVDELFN